MEEEETARDGHDVKGLDIETQRSRDPKAMKARKGGRKEDGNGSHVVPPIRDRIKIGVVGTHSNSPTAKAVSDFQFSHVKQSLY